MTISSINKAVMKNGDRRVVGEKPLQPGAADVGLDRRGGKAPDGSLRMLCRHIEGEMAFLFL